jgi:hypothetical protein
VNFAETLRGLAVQRGLAVPPAQHPEPLAALDYAVELALKREALATFWREHQLPGQPEAIAAAPVPRAYRTTSKRRAILGARNLTLTFPGAAAMTCGYSPSALDLPEHGAVYAFLVERLARPPMRALAAGLNWAIVRGSADALTLILNLRAFDARIVRAGKQLADAVQEEPLGVRAAFLYLDPSGSAYYLEARRPEGTLSFKRLFGPDWLQVQVEGVRLRFPPTVFSQVNDAMLGVMTASARSLLAPLEDRALLDLYCGYGLFSLTVGRDAAHVLGVDFDGRAVAAARANAAYLRCAQRVRFVAGAIAGDFLARSVRAARAPEVVLLDPPRQGTAPDVAGALADRAPERVAHICCGTDEIPREVAAWSRANYRLRRAVPIDLFAGTANLETMLLLTR